MTGAPSTYGQMVSGISHVAHTRKTLLVFVAVMLALTACRTTEQANATSILNADRQANGLPRLTETLELDGKAENWAWRLAATGVLAHSDLRAGIISCWTALAENVGYGPSVEAVERGFLASPGHRANVLGPYTYVGTGVVRRGAAVYVVQDFERPCGRVA